MPKVKSPHAKVTAQNTRNGAAWCQSSQNPMVKPGACRRQGHRKCAMPNVLSVRLLFFSRRGLSIKEPIPFKMAHRDVSRPAQVPALGGYFVIGITNPLLDTNGPHEQKPLHCRPTDLGSTPRLDNSHTVHSTTIHTASPCRNFDRFCSKASRRSNLHACSTNVGRLSRHRPGRRSTLSSLCWCRCRIRQGAEEKASSGRLRRFLGMAPGRAGRWRASLEEPVLQLYSAWKHRPAFCGSIMYLLYPCTV